MHSIYYDFKPEWGLNFRAIAANGDRIHSFVDQYRAAPILRGPRRGRFLCC